MAEKCFLEENVRAEMERGFAGEKPVNCRLLAVDAPLHRVVLK